MKTCSPVPRQNTVSVSNGVKRRLFRAARESDICSFPSVRSGCYAAETASSHAAPADGSLLFEASFAQAVCAPRICVPNHQQADGTRLRGMFWRSSSPSRHALFTAKNIEYSRENGTRNLERIPCCARKKRAYRIPERTSVLYCSGT